MANEVEEPVTIPDNINEVQQRVPGRFQANQQRRRKLSKKIENWEKMDHESLKLHKINENNLKALESKLIKEKRRYIYTLWCR